MSRRRLNGASTWPSLGRDVTRGVSRGRILRLKIYANLQMSQKTEGNEGKEVVPNYRRSFGDRKIKIEVRVREIAGRGVARAYVALNGEPVLVEGEPLVMHGTGGQAALNRVIRAVEREYGAMVEPKARKRKAKKKRP